MLLNVCCGDFGLRAKPVILKNLENFIIKIDSIKYIINFILQYKVS